MMIKCVQKFDIVGATKSFVVWIIMSLPNRIEIRLTSADKCKSLSALTAPRSWNFPNSKAEPELQGDKIKGKSKKRSI